MSYSSADTRKKKAVLRTPWRPESTTKSTGPGNVNLDALQAPTKLELPMYSRHCRLLDREPHSSNVCGQRTVAHDQGLPSCAFRAQELSSCCPA